MGTIKVTIQTEKRLNAINNLSEAVKYVAKALSSGTQVAISNCNFQGGDPALNIDTASVVNETKIETVPDPEDTKKVSDFEITIPNKE